MGKKRQPGDQSAASLSEPPPSSSSTTTAAPASATTTVTDAPSSSLVVKKDAKPTKGKTKQAGGFSPSPLIICRNKHWRYIACFHGPWLQMPIEILEIMANINYNTPRPHPIDPAVFFDAIKIRKLVEEATDLSVRAASDGPSHMTAGGFGGGGNGGGGGGGGSAGLGLGPGGPHGPRLSRERRYRMNLQACQKLARAYRLDEIACSVATMQGASTLDDIGANVLHRNRDEVDGKYVHFFHEKIPSRQLADHTSLEPLNDIIAACPTDPEPYRTRAMIRGFMHNFEGAVSDFTTALDVHRLYGNRHPNPPAPAPSSSEPSSSSDANGASASAPAGKRAPNVILREEEQPTSLTPQLLFMRACAYLTLACDHGRDTVSLSGPDLSVPTLPPSLSSQQKQQQQQQQPPPQSLPPVPLPTNRRPETPMDPEILASRKTVKAHARRALKDFLAFLAHLDYTPHMPQDAVNEFTEKIGQAASGARNPRHPLPPGATLAPRIVYPVSDLFAASPPAGLPLYPPASLSNADADAGADADTNHRRPSSSTNSSLPAKPAPTSEACTYHPLLTEALHSLLLCHCLLQTSRTELVRHAHNVARLARLADAYPVFQASRSAARADWVDILEKTDLAPALHGPWDVLCSPAPLPSPDDPAPSPLPPSSSSSSTTSSPTSATTLVTNGTSNTLPPPLAKPHQHQPQQQRALARWSVTDDGKEYPIVTDRALLVARWMRDVPFVSTGTAAKKKKRRPPTAAAAAAAAKTAGKLPILAASPSPLVKLE